MILIDLFDEDIINTLVPVFSLRPDKEYIVVDRRNSTTRSFNNIVKTIENRAETKVVIIEVDAGNIEDIDAKLRSLIKLKNESEVYLDLAGGRELLTACGYRYAMENGIIPVYMDFRKERLYSVTDNSEIAPIIHLTIGDYLEAVGARRLEDMHGMPDRDDFDRVYDTAEFIFRNEAAWKRLSEQIANDTSRSDDHMHFRKDLPFSKQEKMILAELVNRGFLSEHKRSYSFPDERSRQYLTVQGSWLELYIYIKACRLFPETAMSVVIDWTADDGLDSNDNEIDVVFMKKSVPVFVSCKMRRPTSADVYEVQTLARRFGGRRAKAVIATTFDLESTATEPNSIYLRMHKMNCGYIVADDFKTKTDPEVFNRALQMTE